MYPDRGATVASDHDDPLQDALWVFINIDQRFEVLGTPGDHREFGDDPICESSPP